MQEGKKNQLSFDGQKQVGLCVYALGFPIAVSHQFSSFERDGRRRSDSTTTETAMNHHTYVLQIVRRDYIPKWIYTYISIFFSTGNYLTHSNWFSHRENVRLVHD